eukprot:TRINITY_DN15608_c0_g1_i1.p1 TRINITY_DN15608_c0_g1~~TRINITY_DN15608_c0_g1_i1.p1  ORF type:complete len:324 (+),score=63.80 TRINITY_DN15608_c0_g1_i1:102-974(+)
MYAPLHSHGTEDDDDDDDEVYMYTHSPAQSDILWGHGDAVGHLWGQQESQYASHASASEFGHGLPPQQHMPAVRTQADKQAEIQARRQRRLESAHRETWRNRALFCGSAAFLILIAFVVTAVYYVCYRDCDLTVSWIQVDRRPTSQGYQQSAAEVSIWLRVDNPNTRDMEVVFVDMRFSFVNLRTGNTHTRKGNLQYPSDDGACSGPPDEERVVAAGSVGSVRIRCRMETNGAEFPQGVRIPPLLGGTCFAMHVSGHVRYKMGFFPVYALVNRTQQLYTNHTCSACSTGT